MSVAGRILKALTAVIRMNDKWEEMTGRSGTGLNRSPGPFAWFSGAYPTQ